MRKKIGMGLLLAVMTLPATAGQAAYYPRPVQQNQQNQQQEEQERLEKERQRKAAQQQQQQHQQRQQQPQRQQPQRQQQQWQQQQQQRQQQQWQQQQQQRQQQQHQQPQWQQQRQQPPQGRPAYHQPAPRTIAPGVRPQNHWVPGSYTRPQVRQHPEYRPVVAHRPAYIPHHTPVQIRERHERFRDHWFSWHRLHPHETPVYFTFLVRERPYYLVTVQSGVWYYKNEMVDFVVPAGHVVLAQDQAWYPGDTVESEEFVMFTEEAYVALDQENSSSGQGAGSEES